MPTDPADRLDPGTGLQTSSCPQFPAHPVDCVVGPSDPCRNLSTGQCAEQSSLLVGAGLAAQYLRSAARFQAGGKERSATPATASLSSPFTTPRDIVLCSFSGFADRSQETNLTYPILTDETPLQHAWSSRSPKTITLPSLPNIERPPEKKLLWPSKASGRSLPTVLPRVGMRTGTTIAFGSSRGSKWNVTWDDP